MDIQKKNIDQKDVDHFSSYAEDWWNVDSTWYVLHDYNQVRVPFVVDNLEKRGMLKNGSLEGLKILDVGCGAGILSEALAKKGGKVVGLDASDALIISAKEHWKSQNKGEYDLEYVCDLVEDHAEKYPEYYDVVVSSEVVEHIVDKESFLDGCLKTLKPGGSIFLTTHSKNWINFIYAKVFGEYCTSVLPIGTHVFDQFITAEDLGKMLEKRNCEVADEIGFFYSILNRKYYFIKSRVLQYGLHAVKAVEKY